MLFLRTTDFPVFPDRPYPTGLELAVVLGSAFARTHLEYRDKERLLNTIDGLRPLFRGNAVYHQYLDALTALVQPAPGGAPDFMGSRSWEAKSCQTILGSWAQMRHAWVLYQKRAEYYQGTTSRTHGNVVEPVPMFFSRIGKVIERTRDFYGDAGLFAAEEIELIRMLRSLLAGVREPAVRTGGIQALDKVCTPVEVQIGHWLAVQWEYNFEVAADAARFEKRLKELIGSVSERRRFPESRLIAEIRDHLHVAHRWSELMDICRRLESIARKEVGAERLDAEDVSFMDNFGTYLASVMFYRLKSYLDPKDDAPRIVDVFHNSFQAESNLEVGVGRPQAVFVLWPEGDGEYLCQGAVLPYCEFPSAEPLSDGEWKEILDSDKCPPRPSWIREFLAQDGTGRLVEGR